MYGQNILRLFALDPTCLLASRLVIILLSDFYVQLISNKDTSKSSDYGYLKTVEPIHTVYKPDNTLKKKKLEISA